MVVEQSLHVYFYELTVRGLEMIAKHLSVAQFAASSEEFLFAASIIYS